MTSAGLVVTTGDRDDKRSGGRGTGAREQSPAPSASLAEPLCPPAGQPSRPVLIRASLLLSCGRATRVPRTVPSLRRPLSDRTILILGAPVLYTVPVRERGRGVEGVRSVRSALS